MLELRRTLGRGYSTPEDAIAPLRAAKPSLPRIIGYLGLPESDVTYRYGGGRGIIGLPARVAVVKEGECYSISVRIDRVPLFLTVLLVGGDAFVVFAQMASPGRLTFGAVVFLVCSIIVANGFLLSQYFLAAKKAVSDFSSGYPKNEG
jgi:hypothetical protein